MRATPLLVPVLLLAACAAPATSVPPESLPEAATPEPVLATEAPSPGWRWESYGGIELQVPDEYATGTAGSPGAIDWCAVGDVEPRSGVNRSWNSAYHAIACPEVRPTSTYRPSVDLGAGEAGPPVYLGDGWVSESVETAGVVVTVTDDDATRRAAILATLRAVGEVDAHGCPADTPLREDGARPGSSGIAPAEVTSVAVCRYALGSEDQLAGLLPAPLLSSSVSGADEGRSLVAALGAAPEGGGPDSPTCVEEVRLGEDLVVLRLTTGDRVGEVVVRYSGCDAHGTDDGTLVRALTQDVLEPVLAGPHRPTSLSGEVALLWRP